MNWLPRPIFVNARVRADERSAGANHRQGLAALLGDRHPRADIDAEGEVRRLSANFQQITRSKSVGDAIDSRADLEQPRFTRTAPATEKKGVFATDLAVVLDAAAGDGTPTLAGALIKTAVLPRASLLKATSAPAAKPQAISAGAVARLVREHRPDDTPCIVYEFMP